MVIERDNAIAPNIARRSTADNLQMDPLNPRGSSGIPERHILSDLKIQCNAFAKRT